MHEPGPHGGVSLRKSSDPAPGPGLSLAKPGVAARSAAQPAPSAGAQRGSTPSRPAERRSRLRMVLPLLGLGLAAALGIARFAHVAEDVAGLASSAQRALTGGAAQGDADDQGSDSRPDVAAGAGSSPSLGGASEDVPSSVPLSAMLLTPDLLPEGIAIDPAAASREMSLDEYRAPYTQTMTPTGCARAKGLMAFDDDPAGVVRRADDLRVPGATGSQQVRRFSSAAAARAFLDEQRAWFADCGRSTYHWTGRTVRFVGVIDTDEGNELLTSARVDHSRTGRATEFDGWVRRGDVVFGAYLTGEPGRERATVRFAGRAVLDRAAQHLAALR